MRAGSGVIVLHLGDRRPRHRELDTRLVSLDDGRSAGAGIEAEAGYGLWGGLFLGVVRPYVGLASYPGEASIRRAVGLYLRDTPDTHLSVEAWGHPSGDGPEMVLLGEGGEAPELTNVGLGVGVVAGAGGHPVEQPGPARNQHVALGAVDPHALALGVDGDEGGPGLLAARAERRPEAGDTLLGDDEQESRGAVFGKVVEVGAGLAGRQARPELHLDEHARDTALVDAGEVRTRTVRGAELRRPPVLPVVLHNGESPWRAPVEVAELIALPEVPAQVRRDLAELQPSQRLHVVDFPRHRQEDLVPGNVVSLQMGFEHAGPSDCCVRWRSLRTRACVARCTSGWCAGRGASAEPSLVRSDDLTNKVTKKAGLKGRDGVPDVSVALFMLRGTVLRLYGPLTLGVVGKA